MFDENQIPEGCDSCPNRKLPGSDRQRGKWGGYLIGLIASILCLSYSYERLPDGSWHPKEEPPLMAWAVTFAIAGWGFGIQLDAEVFGHLLGLEK